MPSSPNPVVSAPVANRAPPDDGAARLPPRGEASPHAKRLEELLDQAAGLADPAARQLIQECLESILALHGEALARIVQLVQGPGPDGQEVLARLTHDPKVSGLLLIHGLHPVDLDTRLRQALEKVRPYMESHGGNVELLSLENGRATLRLQGACKTCSASTVTLELAVRHAIEQACPDLAGFDVV